VGVITVQGLTKRFGAVLAVDDLSFEVDAGSVTGFLGPNGAGKTTTLRALLGLVRPTLGRATILGQSYAELAHPSRRVGAVLEASGYHPGRRALDHLRIAGVGAGLPPGRAESALAAVGLDTVADRRVGGFSLGMRQRLGLAGALLGDPEVLILDEPANGLDPEGIHWLRGFLRSFADRGGTVLVSSHVLSEVAQTVDRVVIVSRGRLVAAATLDELADRTGGAVRVRSEEAARLLKVLAAQGLDIQHADGDLVVVTGTTAKAVGRVAAAAAIPVYEMTSDRANLEDVFLALTATGDEQR
jgi:ABC-2 type transport system ATP-binding protein